MGFWVFMLVINLLIPSVMILFGMMFVRKAPKEINFIFGYRTERAMKNRDTWEFAHKFCGRLWLICGALLLPLSVIPFLFVIGADTDLVGTVGAIVCGVQMIPLIGSVFPTEIALKNSFDKDGNRKG